MENFLSKVRKATRSLGKAPFDDEKTRAAIDKATDEAIAKYKQLREEKQKKREEQQD